MWTKLDDKELEKIVLPGNEQQKINNLKDLIKKYNFVDYRGYNSGCLIMNILSNGDFSNGEKEALKYGKENERLTHPLIDHALFFRDKNGKVFLVSNPYLEDEEIKNSMSELKAESKNKYNTLLFDIIGKNKTYHNIKETNLVVFYTLLN